MIKVAHIAYDLQIGGVASILNQLLDKKTPGYEQVLILLCGGTTNNENLSHVKTYRLNYKPSDRYSLPAIFSEAIMPDRYFSRIASDLKGIHQKENFNILHFHVVPRDLQIGSLLLKRNKSIKLVYTDHALRITKEENDSIKGKILKLLYRRLYRKYNTIFVSKQAYDWARQIGLITNNWQNTYIENSVEINKYSKKRDYQTGKTVSIVYVSRITAVKGHFLLIAVARILIEKFNFTGFRFVLIGPGELTGKLKQEIKNNNLMDHFVFEGARNDIPAVLTSYDLAVFPSEREGLPVALLEKMAAGLPVVASAIPEIKNVIQNTNEALLFEPGNAEACARLLYSLIGNQELREKTGYAGRMAVEMRYSTPLVEKYILFYNKLLGIQPSVTGVTENRHN